MQGCLRRERNFFDNISGCPDFWNAIEGLLSGLKNISCSPRKKKEKKK